MKRIAAIAAAVAAVFCIALAGSVSATQPPDHRVTICHATPPDTAANGWHQITVDIASSGYLKAGHLGHGADIIPPYVYPPASFVFSGLNWDAVGASTWANGCARVAPPETPAPTPVVTPTPAPTPIVTPVPGDTPSPSKTRPTPPATDTDLVSYEEPAGGWDVVLFLLFVAIASIAAIGYFDTRRRKR